MSYTVPGLELSDSEASRFDLQFHGVGHAGPSYRARIFLNNSDATPKSAPIPESGYAGSYYVFGHGGCAGDEGHCHLPGGSSHRYDLRPGHKLVPQVRIIEVTEAVRRVTAAGNAAEIAVTVVVDAVTNPDGSSGGVDEAELFEAVALVAYD